MGLRPKGKMAGGTFVLSSRPPQSFNPHLREGRDDPPITRGRAKYLLFQPTRPRGARLHQHKGLF